MSNCLYIIGVAVAAADSASARCEVCRDNAAKERIVLDHVAFQVVPMALLAKAVALDNVPPSFDRRLVARHVNSRYLNVELSIQTAADNKLGDQ